MARAALKDAVPVRERPAPMTRSLVPGWGVEGDWPILMQLGVDGMALTIRIA